MSEERQAWLLERQKGLGGSDIAAMLGLSKWKSPYQLYLDKRGELPEQDDNEAMYWGRELEPVILKRYELETGLKVTTGEGILEHPDYPFMRANLDGRVDAERIVEIKTARSGDGWGEIGTAEIPLPYALQCQWYLFITGAVIADVAVLIGGSDFRMYQVRDDLELQEMLKNAAIEFWERVQAGTPPDVTTYDDAMERYGRSPATGQAWATEEIFETTQELKSLRDTLKLLGEREEAYKAQLCKFMADQFDTILDPDGKPLVTWKLAKGRSTFNSKSFQAEQPYLYDQFVTTSEPSRRLLIK